MNPPSRSKPFLYRDFQQAIEILKDALLHAPTYALLLGDSGSGKTTLLRTLSAALDPHRFHILYLCHRAPGGLNRLLAEALHLPLNLSRTQTGSLLRQSLRSLCAPLLLYLDEAQMIDEPTLHDIRLLAEAELDGPALFSVLFSALPAFQETLRAPTLLPLRRRIRPTVTLTGLRREELIPFLAHAIGQQDASRFSEPALTVLFEHSRAIPALLVGFAQDALRAYPKTLIGAEALSELLEHIHPV